MLKYYILENNVLCLYTLYQKRKGQLWTYKLPNGNKVQLDYIMINKKWKNSSKNCIVTEHFKLSLRSNKRKKNKAANPDWTSLNKPDIQNRFVNEVRNKFELLKGTTSNISTNIIYEHLETSCRESANEIIPIKEKFKNRIPWKNQDICLKRKNLHQAAQLKNSCPSEENTESNNLAQELLYATYDTEQEIYLQSKIDEIKMAVLNKKSDMAWTAVNDVSGRKNSNKAKIKTISGEERIIVWHNHFKDLLGNTPEITVSSISKITIHLNIETSIFTK